MRALAVGCMLSSAAALTTLSAPSHLRCARRPRTAPSCLGALRMQDQSGEPDLSAMTFDERLAYLSSKEGPAANEGGAASPVAVTPETVMGETDLSTMSFDERLEYLSANAPSGPVEEDDEESLFGFDAPSMGTQPIWSFAFWKACFTDLSEMQWPTVKQTGQTLVASQIAFVAIIGFILVFDATIEAAVRTLLEGDSFVVTLDAIFKKDFGT
jgi:preprotein translocase subunit SecE